MNAWEWRGGFDADHRRDFGRDLPVVLCRQASSGEGFGGSPRRTSVPLFIINGRVVLSGAQPPEVFQQAFDQADAEAAIGETCEIDPTTGESTC